MYRTLVTDVIETPFGHGFKDRAEVKGFAVDSGILTVLFSLGWLGSLLFAAGILPSVSSWRILSTAMINSRSRRKGLSSQYWHKSLAGMFS